MTTVRATLREEGGEPIEVAIDPGDGVGALRARIGDRELDFEPAPEGLRVGSRVMRARVARRDDGGVEVWIDGARHVIERVERGARRAGGADAAATKNALEAPMPGTILRIEREAGAAFEAGATLVVMESMKMEMSLSLPVAGRVAEVLCAVGDLVDLGATLVRIERDEAEG